MPNAVALDAPTELRASALLAYLRPGAVLVLYSPAGELFDTRLVRYRLARLAGIPADDLEVHAEPGAAYISLHEGGRVARPTMARRVDAGGPSF